MKSTNAVLRFKKDAPYHAGLFVYKLRSDKGYLICPHVEDAVLFTNRTAAESYLTAELYVHFTQYCEVVTISELVADGTIKVNK